MFDKYVYRVLWFIVNIMNCDKILVFVFDFSIFVFCRVWLMRYKFICNIKCIKVIYMSLLW